MNTENYLNDRAVLLRSFIPPNDCGMYFRRLRDEINWLALSHGNDGNTVFHPRLTAAYGERAYDYAGLKLTPEPWIPWLHDLKVLADKMSKVVFNSVLMQYYRHGDDRVNWHSDNDPCVGNNPVIVSLSFGASCKFQLRNKHDYDDRLELELRDGDMFIMRGDLQHTYDHRVPRDPGRLPRVNLTFRKITTSRETGS